MSQERVGRLEALLSRVQENRKRTRTPAGIGLVKPEVVARAAPEPMKPSLTQTVAGMMPAVQHAPVAVAAPEPARPISPARPAPVAAQAAPMRSAPPAPLPKLQVPARPAIAEPARAAAPAVESPRRPTQDRGATPIEIAVAELDLPSGGAKPEVRRDREQSPAVAAAPMAPPISPEEAFAPRVIEPEPMREPARPIAQVVSRHSPPADATFGAMLKRSLSLRPH
jgi:hypothetical protein